MSALPPGVQERRLTDQLTARLGYSDGHVELDYKGARFFPTVTTNLTAEELLNFCKVFDEARAIAEKLRNR